MAEITDRKSALAWLETQEHQTQIWFACRCALRTIPILNKEPTEPPFGLVFTCFRAMLISTAASTCPPHMTSHLEKTVAASIFWDAVTYASTSASSNALYASSSAASAVAYACSTAAAPFSVTASVIGSSDDRASSIGSAAGALSAPVTNTSFASFASVSPTDFYSAASVDSSVPDTWPKLWPTDGLPGTLQNNWRDLRAFMNADQQTWAFWLEWYEAILNGEPLDWALNLRIATELTVDDWEKGGDDWLISARHVARRIEQIRIEFATSIGPELVLQDDGLYGFAKDADIGGEPLAYASNSVKSALDAALIGGSANGLNETSSETVLIRSALNEYQDSPSMVATNFWNACMSLNKNIGDIYPDDAALLGLKNTLYTSVEEICAQSPLVKDRVARLAALEVKREATEDEKAQLRQVPDEIADVVTSDAQRKIQQVIADVTEKDKPPIVSITRLLNWLTTVWRGIELGQKAEKTARWLFSIWEWLTTLIGFW